MYLRMGRQARSYFMGDKDMGTSRDRCNITHVLVHAWAGREVYD